MKADRRLLELLERMRDGESVQVDIIPVQDRWRGLLRQLRAGAPDGVEYNVIDLTTVAATVPARMLPTIAARRDVAELHLRRDA
jgi:hypothetical protein